MVYLSDLKQRFHFFVDIFHNLSSICASFKVKGDDTFQGYLLATHIKINFNTFLYLLFITVVPAQIEAMVGARMKGRWLGVMVAAGAGW